MLLVAAAAAAHASERRPNVVVLLADDLGYGETGAQGSRRVPTPHIDSIAAGGVRCTAGYVMASFCGMVERRI